MAEPDDTGLFRRALALRVSGDPRSTPDCLEDDTLAAMAEGRLDADRRAAALTHVVACTRCRSQVASVARALGDSEVAREVRAVEGGARRETRRTGWAGVAAAAMLLLLVGPEQFDEVQHRSPITAAPAPTAVWPVGTVADASSLRWTPVPRANRYRVALFDADAEMLYLTELADTVAVLPDSIRPRPGESYSWRVEARIGFDRWVVSPSYVFSIVRGPQR